MMVTQGLQSEAEFSGYVECVGVVLALHPSASGKGIGLEPPGLLMVTQRRQRQAEQAGSAQGVGAPGS